jgi:beta-lactam-binding protein with PASTA domain
MKALAKLGMTARVLGDGIVVGQQPSPGSSIEPGATATLTLERRVSTDTSSPRPQDTPQ